MACFIDGPELDVIARKAKYKAAAYHKSDPENWGLSRSRRIGKSVCDSPSISSRRDAARLLRSAIRLGMISKQRRGDWPQKIWAVDDSDIVYEAQLSNKGTGEYHGYPMIKGDSFAAYIRSEWKRRCETE